MLGEEPPRGVAAGVEARRALLGASIHALRRDLTPAHFVEVGIGCESCHGGSREHVKSDPRCGPTSLPRSPFLRVRPPPGSAEPTRAEAINRTCARCHQVLFSRYPFTWEGGVRRAASNAAGVNIGGSSINSGEARDFLLGGCARQMSCTTCHDPHAEDRRDKLEALQTPAGNHVCTALPRALRRARGAARARAPRSGRRGRRLRRVPHAAQEHGARLRAHPLPPHRLADRRGARRAAIARSSARSATPTSVGTLVADMERWWGKRYDRGALARSTAATSTSTRCSRPLERGKAHEQAAAMAVLGEKRVEAALAPVARQLVNPIPLVRYYARRALEAIRGTPCAIDLDRPTPEIEAAVRRCVPAAWPPGASGAAPGAPRSRAGGGDESDDD